MVLHSHRATIIASHLQNFFLFHLKLCPLNSNSHQPLPLPLPPPVYFLSLWIWLFWGPHRSDIIQCSAFCDGLISLSIMSSGFIRVLTGVRIFFLRLQYISPRIHTASYWPIYPSVGSWVASPFGCALSEPFWEPGKFSPQSRAHWGRRSLRCVNLCQEELRLLKTCKLWVWW